MRPCVCPLCFPILAEPVLCQFIEAADSRHLCTLLGVCSDGAANSEAAEQHMLRQRSLLSSVLARLQGQSNDACDVCKVGGGARQ